MLHVIFYLYQLIEVRPKVAPKGNSIWQALHIFNVEQVSSECPHDNIILNAETLGPIQLTNFFRVVIEYIQITFCDFESVSLCLVFFNTLLEFEIQIIQIFMRQLFPYVDILLI